MNRHSYAIDTAAKGRTTDELYLKIQAKLNYLLCGFMAPLHKPSHIEWISSSLRDKKEQILERNSQGVKKNWLPMDWPAEQTTDRPPSWSCI